MWDFSVFRFCFFFLPQVVYRACVLPDVIRCENMHAREPRLGDTPIAVERRAVGFYLQFEEGGFIWWSDEQFCTNTDEKREQNGIDVGKNTTWTHSSRPRR